VRNGTRQVAIVEAVRTPIGRGHPEKGVFADVHPNELLGACFSAVVSRSGIDPERVDDVVVGCVSQHGVQSINVARNAWLQAGLPVTTPATTVDRQCGSGQQAVNFGAALIAGGVADVVVAGGVEHMGRVPLSLEEPAAAELGSPWPAELLERYELVHQGEAAEVLAERWSVPREELDELSLRSHRLATAAAAEGRFGAEIVPVAGVTADQGIRPDTSAEALAALRPAFREDGKVTAGNSSQISDGASALLLCERGLADELGLPVRALVADQVTVGVDPVTMLLGPVPATRRLLERSSLTLADVDRFEVNEAFASVLAVWQRELDAGLDDVNVNGGAIALGHPLGCSGARILTTLVHELERAGARRGLATMCCRGGLGTGTLLERP
jgi:acetyl-CoA acetyltransferase family protein